MISQLLQGHWKFGETKREGAAREALEEAGVRGTLGVTSFSYTFSTLLENILWSSTDVVLHNPSKLGTQI